MTPPCCASSPRCRRLLEEAVGSLLRQKVSTDVILHPEASAQRKLESYMRLNPDNAYFAASWLEKAFQHQARRGAHNKMLLIAEAVLGLSRETALTVFHGHAEAMLSRIVEMVRNKGEGVSEEIVSVILLGLEVFLHLGFTSAGLAPLITNCLGLVVHLGDGLQRQMIQVLSSALGSSGAFRSMMSDTCVRGLLTLHGKEVRKSVARDSLHLLGSMLVQANVAQFQQLFLSIMHAAMTQDPTGVACLKLMLQLTRGALRQKDGANVLRPVWALLSMLSTGALRGDALGSAIVGRCVLEGLAVKTSVVIDATPLLRVLPAQTSWWSVYTGPTRLPFDILDMELARCNADPGLLSAATDLGILLIAAAGHAIEKGDRETRRLVFHLLALLSYRASKAHGADRLVAGIISSVTPRTGKQGADIQRHVQARYAAICALNGMLGHVLFRGEHGNNEEGDPAGILTTFLSNMLPHSSTSTSVYAAITVLCSLEQCSSLFLKELSVLVGLAAEASELDDGKRSKQGGDLVSLQFTEVYGTIPTFHSGEELIRFLEAEESSEAEGSEGSVVVLEASLSFLSAELSSLCGEDGSQNEEEETEENSRGALGLPRVGNTTQQLQTVEYCRGIIRTLADGVDVSYTDVYIYAVELAALCHAYGEGAAGGVLSSLLVVALEGKKHPGELALFFLAILVKKARQGAGVGKSKEVMGLLAEMGLYPSSGEGDGVVDLLGIKDMVVKSGVRDETYIITLIQNIAGKPIANNEEAAHSLASSIFGEAALSCICSINWSEPFEQSESQSSTPSTQKPSTITRAMLAERAAVCRSSGLVSLASHCLPNTAWHRRPQSVSKQNWNLAGSAGLLLG